MIMMIPMIWLTCGLVLTGIFTVHLEKTTLMTILKKFLKPWKIYVGNTIIYIKPDFITDVKFK